MRLLAAAISPGDVGFADWACAAEAPSEIAAKAARGSTCLWVWSERYAGVLRDPQGFVEVRVIEHVPERVMICRLVSD